MHQRHARAIIRLWRNSRVTAGSLGCAAQSARASRINYWRRHMADSVRPIPEGYHTATPYLICSGGAAAIDFYKRAFGAVELMRMPMPNGRLGHAELKIGDSVIMLADENPESGFHSPQHYGGTPVSVLLYVDNVDAVFEQA